MRLRVAVRCRCLACPFDGVQADGPHPMGHAAAHLKGSCVNLRDMNSLIKVNLAEAFARFSDHWSPKVAGELNGQQVKLAKLQGPFIWHRHENEDELFLVVSGRLRIEFRDQAVTLEEGEFLIVPRGVE